MNAEYDESICVLIRNGHTFKAIAENKACSIGKVASVRKRLMPAFVIRDRKCLLTDDQVREIRIKKAAGSLIRALALEYGVSKTTIGDACQGKQYGNVN